MKRTKLLAGLTAVVMAVTTFLTPVATVKAEEATVTDKPSVAVNYENKEEVKYFSDKDKEYIASYFGWSQTSGSVNVLSGPTSYTVDWNNSAWNKEDVKEVSFSYVCFKRDENGDLDWVERDYYRLWTRDEAGQLGGLGDEKVDLSDVSGTDYCLYRLHFEKYTGAYYDSIFIYKDTQQAFEYKEVDDTTLSETGTEDYSLDLSTGSTVVSSDSFATLLEENKTKNVVIKSNNGVTFTFAKGTMQSVEGMSSYDFTTTINTTYNADMPYYVTQNNFVSLIDYNYSGKLPAEASITFYVGTQYAGKTLYYSLMNENKTFAEVQTIVVDDKGYMTVKQNHCSTYVVTTEQPVSVMTAKEVKVSKTSITYNGKKQTPMVTVYDTNGNEIGSEYYSVSYANNKNVGRATVTVELKGNYSGTLTTTFDIVPKKTSITSVSAKKKGFAVKWKKQKKQTSGYEIEYSLKKNFKGAKSVVISNNKTVSKNVSKLKAKKKYYVRIRTYKKVKINGKATKLYSGWSAAKNVVTK